MRRGLDWIFGEIPSLQGWSGTGRAAQGSPHPWRIKTHVDVAPEDTVMNRDVVGVAVVDDLKGLSQLQQFHNFMK